MDYESLKTILSIVVPICSFMGFLWKGLNKKFDSIDQRFEKIDLRFEKIDERFDKIDQKFEKIDERFDKIDQKFEKVYEHLIEIRSDISDVKERLAFVEAETIIYNTIPEENLRSAAAKKMWIRRKSNQIAKLEKK